MFNLLAGLSLLLCIATLLFRVVAQRLPFSHVKLWWTTGPGNEDNNLLSQNGGAELRAFDAEHRSHFFLPRPPPSDIPSHLEMIVLVQGFDGTGYFSEEYEQIVAFDNYTPAHIKEADRIGRKLASLAPSNTTTTYWDKNAELKQPINTFNTEAQFGNGRRLSFASVAKYLTIAPMVWLVVSLFHWLRKQQERKMGKCIHCGYALRATPDRCPECGTIPKPA